jgi:hypothetical protein
MLPALPRQRRALVHRVQPRRDHHRANDRHWNGYDFRGSEHQQPGRHHRRTGRSHVVHRQRQRYWPDHYLSDTHDQSIHPHLGSGRNNGHHHRPQPGRARSASAAPPLPSCPTLPVGAEKLIHVTRPGGIRRSGHRREPVFGSGSARGRSVRVAVSAAPLSDL